MTFKSPTPDLEVKVKEEKMKAIIEGRTAVPFKTFVGLVLQRKVFPLFKKWGDEPVIINSELLTTLASAAQDSQENRSKLILVTLGVGALVGVFFFSVGQVILIAAGITLATRDLLLIAGGLVGLTIIVSLLDKLRRRGKGENIAEKMEKVASLLSK
tara:strand:+ start:4001 stop:4471 length:471 start_codon:yes stop_codon:yes gene_type:complete